MSETIRWLHLTDLHAGMTDQDWLWPRMRDKFHEDLQRIYQKAGPWDLVLFTGDLVQEGTDYAKLDKILAEIWSWFKELGCDPKLLAVPGNHDLQWQDPEQAAVDALENWSSKEWVQRKFWAEPDGEYRQVVNTAFAAYDNWWKGTALKPDHVIHGALPGDFSCTYEKNGFRLGLVGLNSAFLQLTNREASYQEHLAVDPRQFHEACGGNGVQWAESHHVCFLMTHHPPQWLHPDCRRHLNGEILESFCLHLCGHNHLTDVQQILTGGASDAPRQCLGRSLFGLARADKGKIDRSHGYVSGELRVQSRPICLQFMPRCRVERQGGRWALVPDQTVDLPVGNDRTKEFPIRLNPVGGGPHTGPAPDPETRAHDARFVMHVALESVCATLKSDKEPFVSMRRLVLAMAPDDGPEVTVEVLERILKGCLMDLMSRLRRWLEDDVKELEEAGRVRDIVDVFAVAGLDSGWVEKMVERFKRAAHIEVPLWTDIHLSEAVLTALLDKAVGSWVRERWIDLKDVESPSTEPQGRREDIRKRLADRRLGQILQRNVGESQEAYERRRKDFINTRLPRVLKVDRQDGKPYVVLYCETAEQLKADIEADPELWDQILKLEQRESCDGVILDEVELHTRLQAIFTRLDQLGKKRASGVQA